VRLLRRTVCFLICRHLFVPEGTPIKQRLYCCLLFFFNFFQYVKELFDPGRNSAAIINVPFVTGTGDGGE
jgi:hypothetical protein